MDLVPLLLALVLLAVLAAVVLLFVLLQRRPDAGADALAARLEDALRAEQREGRMELRGVLEAQQRFGAQLGERMTELTARTDQRLEGFGQRLEVLRATFAEDARKARQEGGDAQQRAAEALAQRLTEVTQRSEQRLVEMRTTL